MQHTHLPAEFARSEFLGEDARRHPRTRVFKRATVYPVLRESGLQIDNVSRLGLAGRCAVQLSLHQRVHLSVDGDRFFAADVRWAHGDRYGYQLLVPVHGLCEVAADPQRAADGLIPRAPRLAVEIAATLVTTSPRLPGRIRNVSERGMLVEIAGRVREAERLLVEMPDGSALVGRVQWSSDNHAGLAFRHPLPADFVPGPVRSDEGRAEITLYPDEGHLDG